MTSEAATSDVRALAETYFGATARRDLDGMLACWSPDGVEYIPGIGELYGHDAIRAYFTGLFAALPDFTYRTLRMIVEGDYAAVHWQAGGHFTGQPWQGYLPNGRFTQVRGIDLIRFDEGLIVRNDVAFDTMEMIVGVGFLPPREALVARALQRGQNLVTQVKSAVAARSAR